MKKKIITAIAAAAVLIASGIAICGLTERTGKAENREASGQLEEQTKEEETDSEKEASKDVFAMDTYMTMTAYGEEAEEAVSLAEEEILRLESLLSATDGKSEIYMLNQEGRATLSEDSACLLERALDLYEETGGIFDPAVYPVMEAWGFPTQEYKVPDEETLQAALSLTDASKIDFQEENGEIRFGMEGMKIDFGGIAKGYTSSKIMGIYRECGIESGIVNLGGNVHVLGTKPDGSLWRVAVQSPEDENGYLGVLSISDRAVITSGGYERYFEQDGKAYHHIIDPRTGYPAENGLTSVTIVSEDGTLADGLSTALFVMGREKAEQFWQENSSEFDAILETEDGTVFVTEGIAEHFSSERELVVIPYK